MNAACGERRLEGRVAFQDTAKFRLFECKYNIDNQNVKYGDKSPNFSRSIN